MPKVPASTIETGPRQARSLTSAVFANLRADILSGRLNPGEKLHIGNLAKSYGVSLAAVREALSRLVADGLVVAEDQRGFRVSPASLKDLDDVTESRIEIECLALRRSIRRGGPEWLDAIASAWRAMAGERPGNERWPTIHNGFHAALVGSCGLDWLMRFRLVLFEQSERYRSLSRLPKRPARDLHREHRELMDATIARDEEGATRLLAEHYNRTRDLVLESYAAPPEPMRDVPASGRTRLLANQIASRGAAGDRPKRPQP